MSDLREATSRRGSIVDSFKAVAWAFFGVRRRGAHETDLARLNPLHLVIIGFVCLGLFVGALILVVRFVVGAA